MDCAGAGNHTNRSLDSAFDEAEEGARSNGVEDPLEGEAPCAGIDPAELGPPDCALVGAGWRIPVHRCVLAPCP